MTRPARPDAVYRVDHALAMAPLHALLARRTTDPELRARGNAEHIELSGRRAGRVL
jgi:hypothetical protein